MKKRLVFGIVLLLVGALAACSRTAPTEPAPSGESVSVPAKTEASDAEPVPESSASSFSVPVDPRTVMIPTHFIETESLYIGKSSFSDYLWYWDKETREGGTLCGRPECLHNTSDCDAWVGDLEFGCLSHFENTLYWIGFDRPPASGLRQYGIWSMDLKTGRRELIRELDYADMIRYDFQYSYLFGSCYYRLGISDSVEEGLPSRRITLTETPLRGGGPAVVFQKSFPEEANADAFLCFHGSRVFLLWRQEKDAEKKLFSAGIVSWDPSEKLLREHWEGDVPAPFNQFRVTDSEEFLLTTKGQTLYSGMYRVANGELPPDPTLTAGMQGYDTFTFQDGLFLLLKPADDFSQEKQIYRYDIRLTDPEGTVLTEKTVFIDPALLPESGPERIFAIPALFCDRNYLYADTHLLDRSSPDHFSLLFRFDLSDSAPSGQLLNGLFGDD